MAQVVDSDLVQAALYGGLTLVLDVWLLSHTGFAGRAVATLGALVVVGALVGVGLLRRRRGAPGDGIRLLRGASTGGLYSHLVLPAAVLVDLLLHPDHTVRYLGGVY
ncbi:hypothetical protein OG401_01950 [Kitasatospora purpeofusca]|uniref:hypothetical protein n=1 Tax=Kitasatospora purpeofusca TaxID=67352 RepID=UPI002258AE8D|nr:hypothetical protein [Kitasatospora purpeofusca]MCX4683082.1 hypothetical protein [Kitasatospora purpeofusca]